MSHRHTQHDRITFYHWVIIGSACAIQAGAWGSTQGSFGVFIHPITEDMHWSRTAVSSAFSLLLITNFSFGLFWGWVSDRWGIRRVIAITGSLMGAGLFFAGMANSLWQLYLFYGLVAGIGLGGTTGPLVAMTGRWFQKRRALAIGIVFAGTGIGSSVLPIMSERLIALSGWPLGMKVLAIVIWSVFIAGALLLRTPPTRLENQQGTGKVDVEDTIVPAGPPTSTEFVRSLRSRPSTTLATALRSRNLWLLLVMQLLGTLVLFEVLVHLMARAIDVGISSSSAVLLLTVLNFLSIGGKLTGGALGDRIGNRKVFIASLLIQAITLIWLTWATELWMFYIFAAAWGLSYGSWTPQIPAILIGIFGPVHTGAIYGTVLLGAGIGGIIGPVMAGYIFDTTGSYGVAFIVGASSAMLAIVLALAMKQEKQPSTT